MSSGAIAAWQANVTRDLLEQARQSIDPQHRTTVVNMALVGQHLAVKQRSKGFCNESHQQIYEGLFRVLTLETIGRALRCLDYPGLWQIVKPGGKGSPTRRVLTSFDPHGLIQSHGGQAPHDETATHGDNELSHGDSSAIARGLDTQHTGVSPRTPKGSPKQLPKYSPNYPSACNEQSN
jgi:hypothetical protein